jgi:uncharacterized SAM-binding protein YcdF (DUF218 family)
MFVYLSKLLPLFIYPLGLACLFLLFTMIFNQYKHNRRGWVIAALILLIISGNRYVSMGLARSLEWRDLPPETTPQAEVIVLLGGGTESADPPRPMTEVNSAGDRVLYAAKLYQDGAAPIILASGGNLDFSTARGTSPAEEMKALLTLAGVPEDAIWLQPESENTHDDAVFSAEILDENDITEIILVTSAMHMPRAKALFEAQGLEVIPAPVDFTVTEKSWESAFNPRVGEFVISLLPNASSLGVTTNVIKEYLGMLIYQLQGWL